MIRYIFLFPDWKWVPEPYLTSTSATFINSSKMATCGRSQSQKYSTRGNKSIESTMRHKHYLTAPVDIVHAAISNSSPCN